MPSVSPDLLQNRDDDEFFIQTKITPGQIGSGAL